MMRVSVLRTGTSFGYSSTQKTLLTRSVYRVLVVISTSTKRDMLSERESKALLPGRPRNLEKFVFESPAAAEGLTGVLGGEPPPPSLSN